jgi:signal peptidase I
VVFPRRAKLALAVLGGLVVLAGATWALLAARYDLLSLRQMGLEMQPNLGAGVRVLVDRRRAPRRGDVIVMTSHAKGKFALRRVVGVPGDRYAFKGEHPVVNGVRATWETIGYTLVDGREFLAQRETLDGRTHVVLDDVNRRMNDMPERTLTGYWVLDDNRDYLLANDSRSFEDLAPADVRGVVTWVIEPGDLTYIRLQSPADAGPPTP